MPKRLRKMPRDINELGKAIVDLTTGDREAEESHQKILMPSLWGLRDGSNGGKMRAQKLSPARRKQIARKAAKARWKK